MKGEELSRLRRTLDRLERIREELGDEAFDTAFELVGKRLDFLEAGAARQLRKYVTVVFADVTGFTSICEKHDAEYVTGLINTLWNELDSTVMRHGGMVDKHIGDAVMAVWGAERVREDDTARALRAALEMQERASGIVFDEKRGIRGFTMRVGVHSGPVFLGGIGLKGEYTAMGDTVNIASRLQSSAPEGSVVISHDAYRHVKEDFTFEQREPISLKGLEFPIRTWIVVSSRPRRFHGQGRDFMGMRTPMVGRDLELGELESSLSQVTGDGRPMMVTVSGEAGIGKSRLLLEFRELVEKSSADGELSVDTVFFNARCTPEMRNVPCSVYRDILRFRMEVMEDESPEAALEKLVAGMGRHLSEDETCLACHYAGFDLSGQEPVRRLLGTSALGSEGSAALVKYFRDTCRDNRTLIYLEDLHWADSTSLDFTERLLGELKEGRLLVLALTRPFLFESRPEWGRGCRHRRIDLRPLSTDDSARLVTSAMSCVSGIPEDLARNIVDIAEGNPFYLEELLAMLIDRGVVTLGEQGASFDQAAMLDWTVPPTLTGVLQARLDSLPDDEKDLLQRASVIGRMFWDVALRSLYEGHDGAAISRGLSSVQTRDLVRSNPESTFGDSLEYLFKHAILRDVTYETVLLAARRTYHRRTADWLLERSGQRTSEFAGLIAEHLYRGEDWRRATDWFIRAGKSAFTTSAYAEALEAFRRALDIMPDDLPAEDLAGLYLATGKTLDKLTRYGEAESILQQARETATQNDLPSLCADALLGLAWLATVRGMWDTAREFGTSAHEEALRSGDRAMLARAIMRMADFEERSFEARIPCYEESYRIYSELGDRAGLAITTLNMGNTAMSFGRADDGERYYAESLGHYREIGDKWGIANCLGNLGNVAVQRHDYQSSRDLHTRSREISLSIGDMEGVIICDLNLGRDEHSLGDHARGSEHHFMALRRASELGIPPLALAALYELSVHMRAESDYKRAAIALLTVVRMRDSFVADDPNADPEAELLETRGFLSEEEYSDLKRFVDSATLNEVADRIV